MKPKQDGNEDDNKAPAGDVIGDTAYSERFVLKILLKLANSDSLKDEVKEKSFEDDLCTLWDMTAERDVVLFLQKHDVLNLFNFALPTIDSPRIIEIVVGIVGNMCCHRDATKTLLNMENFLKVLLGYIKTDDSLILIQLLRLINSAMFLANDEDICTWMKLFQSFSYSEALYFMLKNSSHKKLLITALENLNTVTSYCNIEKTRADFFEHFVTLEALESLTTAFMELIVKQKDLCEKEDLERVLLISLQIILNMIGFNEIIETYGDCKETIINMINHILLYYEDKLVVQKEIDSDLADIIDSTNTILHSLNLIETSDLGSYFVPSYNMWKAMSTATKAHQNGNSDFEDNDEGLAQFSKQIKSPLSNLLCNYMLKCTERQLAIAVDTIGTDYEGIVSDLNNKNVLSEVSKRTATYRTRLKDTLSS